MELLDAALTSMMAHGFTANDAFGALESCDAQGHYIDDAGRCEIRTQSDGWNTGFRIMWDEERVAELAGERAMDEVTAQDFPCETCGEIFSQLRERDLHECPPVPASVAPSQPLPPGVHWEDALLPVYTVYCCAGSPDVPVYIGRETRCEGCKSTFTCKPDMPPVSSF
jgi:hypothetical protein